MVTVACTCTCLIRHREHPVISFDFENVVMHFLSSKSFCWDYIKRPPVICDLFIKVP